MSMRRISLALLVCSISVNAQKVNVTIFTESKCKYCTILLRQQIWPFYDRHPGVLNVQMIPFGKGDCVYLPNHTLFCHCMHGQDECDLNRLQNCAIAFFPLRYLGLVTCIQGLSNIYEAFSRCLYGLTEKTRNMLIDCATTQFGETLNYHSMISTRRAGIALWPAIFINGRYYQREFVTEMELCRYTAWC